ncbi:MAG: 30S ribosomal protein S12 methylthiotransferase RimO, partial [Lachnospiraceae bacterium]|nr:30S ribosomal protein S12 methylthiotransferase RimO [Lachnospiraceae bacterium]
MTGEGIKVFVMSLGCDKNLADTEHMMGIMAADGYSFTQDEEEADVILINTCCFINDAKEESVNALLEMAEYRKQGKCRALIVTGCLAQRYADEIRKELPEVDAVVGTTAYDNIGNVLDRVLN